MLLDPDQLDALQEIINIGIGNASKPLSELTQSHVELQVPNIKMINPSELEAALNGLHADSIAVIEMGFDGASKGKGMLAFPKEDALELVEVLAGEKLGTPDMDSLKVGILTEFGNIILGQFFSAVGNFLRVHFKLGLPVYEEGEVASMLLSGKPKEDSLIIVVTTQFKIRKLMTEGKIFVLFNVESLPKLIDAIENL